MSLHVFPQKVEWKYEWTHGEQWTHWIQFFKIPLTNRLRLKVSPCFCLALQAKDLPCDWELSAIFASDDSWHCFTGLHWSSLFLPFLGCFRWILLNSWIARGVESTSFAVVGILDPQGFHMVPRSCRRFAWFYKILHDSSCKSESNHFSTFSIHARWSRISRQ